MTRTIEFRPLGTKLRLLNCIATFILLSPIVCANAIAQNSQDMLAVINSKGEVWARVLSQNSIGGGYKLTGPSLFGGPDERFVVTFPNTLAVVTKSGVVWSRTTSDNQTISAGSRLSGTLFGGSDAKYVFGGPTSGPNCHNAVYVVTNKGTVWTHSFSFTGGIGGVGNGIKLNGPTLFGGANDKYVVHDGGNRVLVINTNGEVWAHNLSASTPRPPDTFCDPDFDTIGAGYKLNGPALFAAASNDSYVVSYGGRLLVINSLGQVWARDVTGSSVGAGFKLNGPGLFGTPNDARHVVQYRYDPPPIIK